MSSVGARPGEPPFRRADHVRACGDLVPGRQRGGEGVRGRRRRPGPRGRVRAVRPGGRRCAGRLVSGLRARRRRHQGHGGPPAVAQRVPVGPARSRRGRPSRCWCGSAASTARSPTSRWTRCPSPRRRSATPPPKTTSGWTPRCRSATRGRSSSSASDQDPPPAPADPHRDRHRHGLRGRGAAHRRAVERGVLLQAAAHPVPVQRRGHRQQPGDLPRLARQVGDRGADPHVRALRRRREHPGQLHLHAGRALPAGRPDATAPRPSAGRSPSSAR